MSDEESRLNYENAMLATENHRLKLEIRRLRHLGNKLASEKHNHKHIVEQIVNGRRFDGTSFIHNLPAKKDSHKEMIDGILNGKFKV